MDKTLIKTICIITAFSMAIAIIIGSIAIMRSTRYLTTEIDEKIVAVAEKYADDFSAEFNHMEGLTDSLASYVETTFDVDAYEKDHEGYLDRYKEQLAKMIKSDLKAIKSAHSLYVTFNPELTSRNDEVWYSFINGEIREISADFQNNKRKFTLPYEKNMEYFFKPQGKDHGVWISSYYDKDIKKRVFSYSNAIYVDGFFVGVAGADISAEDTVRIIEEMSLYSGGYSALLDENYQFIVHNDKDPLSEEAEIKKILKEEFKRKGTSKSGELNYIFKDTKKIMGFSKMRNGWTFITIQPEAVVYNPIASLRGTMVMLGFCLVVVFVAFLIAFTRPFIRKTNTLEEENRKKEIIIAYQSRQAKIGEMVGNITHQWKQPLNTINLIQANLLDSYRYGDLDEKRLEKSVHKVENIVDKMSETITDFSDFLKPTKEKIFFDVNDCIKSAISLMEESINLHQIKIEISCETDEKAYGYYNDTTHVIFNLLNNARDAIVKSHADERQIHVTVSSDSDMVQVSVINKGNNITPEEYEHMFEPYFTTKEDMGGTGLGLYISKQIVEERLQGKISIENITDGVKCDIMIPTKSGKEDENVH